MHASMTTTFLPLVRQLLVFMALFVVPAGLIYSESTASDGSWLTAKISGMGGQVIAKGKQPASGLVVNVPSGFGRPGLLAPEATFIEETLQATQKRVVSGVPCFSNSAMGNHVGNAAQNPNTTPLRLICTTKDDKTAVRMDLPSGYDLVLIDLIDGDQQRQQVVAQARAFYLDVAGMISLSRYGLVRVEMRFFSSSNATIFKAVVHIDGAKSEAFLEFFLEF